MDLLNVGTNQPYATIQAAITAAPHTGSVQVHAGGVLNSYAEDLLVNNKRVRLYGADDAPPISVTGTGGASPALLVAGTGGCYLENLRFSNAGTSATYIVQLNNNLDYISRCVIDGGGAVNCLLGQFGENLLIKNGLHGIDASCFGSMFFHHCTLVHQATYGMSPPGASEYISNLSVDCNNRGQENGSASLSFWNMSDDASIFSLPGSIWNMLLADIDFVDYAGGDYRLKPTSKAFLPSISILPQDGLGQKRRRTGDACKVFAGYHDPQSEHAELSWLTGTSSIRRY